MQSFFFDESFKLNEEITINNFPEKDKNQVERAIGLKNGDILSQKLLKLGFINNSNQETKNLTIFNTDKNNNYRYLKRIMPHPDKHGKFTVNNILSYDKEMEKKHLLPAQDVHSLIKYQKYKPTEKGIIPPDNSNIYKFLTSTNKRESANLVVLKHLVGRDRDYLTYIIGHPSNEDLMIRASYYGYYSFLVVFYYDPTDPNKIIYMYGFN